MCPDSEQWHPDCVPPDWITQPKLSGLSSRLKQKKKMRLRVELTGQCVLQDEWKKALLYWFSLSSSSTTTRQTFTNHRTAAQQRGDTFIQERNT